MGKYFTGVQLLVAMISLTSCLQAPSTKAPTDPKLSVEQIIESIRQEYNTCDKKDSEQPQVSNEVLVNKIVIEDQIDSQNMQKVDCDGKVLESLGVSPVREHGSEVYIPAPEEGVLNGKVNYVSVENHRTCDSVRAYRTSASDFDSSRKYFEKWKYGKQSDETGRVLVGVGESTRKQMGLFLPIHEGNNVLTVRYFGKCLTYKKEVDNRFGDAFNCEKAEELGSKMVLLELHVTRPVIDGTKDIVVCDKKK